MQNEENADRKVIYTTHPDFPSEFVRPRNVDVWCPPNYTENSAQAYPVIYMPDGQNLFNPTLSFSGNTWGVAETLTQLIDTKFAGAIVVGIWNSGEGRIREYMPQKPLESPAAAKLKADFVKNLSGEAQSDRYLRFVVEELKPFIDRTYRTLPGQNDTIVMGSSMGGLISLYSLVEYPHLFGKAGCLSTHWPIGQEVMIEQLGALLPSPHNHKLYFDFGTEGLDMAYEPFQLQMDSLLLAAGYIQGENCLTLKFEGENHSEQAWRKRLTIPLKFLLGI